MSLIILFLKIKVVKNLMLRTSKMRDIIFLEIVHKLVNWSILNYNLINKSQKHEICKVLQHIQLCQVIHVLY